MFWSRMKQVLGRILKAFENLKDLGYISEYYEEYVKDPRNLLY